MIDWTPERDARLRELHGTMSIPVIAEAMGATRGSIRARVTRLGIKKRDDGFTEAEIEKIRVVYAAEFNEDICLDSLANELGRSKHTISRKARALGLSNISRKWKREPKVRSPKWKTEEERRAAIGNAARIRFATNGHPRGMLGKRHTSEAKERSRNGAIEFWASLSEDEKDQRVSENLKAALKKNGRLGPIVSGRKTTWKAGWREVGDKRHYFRSRWEANYARYLEWLKERGDIVDWEYEPETFWFDGIKRGVRSYLPDFRVHELDGSKPLHEVKGWMDARSKTTLKRMAKYHPAERIILIREREYKAICRFSGLIGDWE